jgi:hypothetical protein
MSDKQITTELSNMSVSELPPKLPNFPLPRELRDKIYGYLLDGDYTRSERPTTPSQTMSEFQRHVAEDNAYQFHTNILMVNRTIHQETEELLYKRNIFVVVSYQWPDMLFVTDGSFWLLTVSKKHTARMTRHSLRIHASPGTNALAESASQTGRKPPMESCIILAKDLEAFCFTLLVAASNTSGPCITVVTSPTGNAQFQTGVFNNRNARSMQLKCELRDSTYRPMSAALQQDLLTPLAVVIAPSQRVAFSGNIQDLSQVASLKRTMSTTLVCRTALLWSHFEALVMARRATDLSLKHDHVGFVTVQYLTLEELSLKFIERDEVRHELSSNHSGLFEAVHIFHLELLVTIACARLKIPDFQGFADSFHAVVGFFSKICETFNIFHIMPDGLEAYLDSIRFWWYLYVQQVDKLPAEFWVTDFQRTANQHGPHQVHDLALLESVPDQKSHLTKEHIPLEKSSAWQLPLPRTSFYKSVPGFEQSNNFKGWLDISLLRSLDDEKRQILKVLQTSSRTEITDVDQL